MTGTVNVRVVPGFALVIHVRNGNGDCFGVITHCASFGDILVGDRVCQILTCLDNHNGGDQGGFAVVNVSDGSNVHVWFGSLKRFFCHAISLTIVLMFQSTNLQLKMEPMTGLEPVTSSLPRMCSTN